ASGVRSRAKTAYSARCARSVRGSFFFHCATRYDRLRGRPSHRGAAVMSDLDRRQLLGTLAGAALLRGRSAARDLIHAENNRDGTLDWQLTYTRVDPKAKWRSPLIEGFAGRP